MNLRILPYVKVEKQILDQEGYPAVQVVHLDNQNELDEMFERRELPRAIYPGERWLMGVDQCTSLSTGVAGLVQLRSTLARAGLGCPATYADPRFEGQLTLELKNDNQYHAIWVEPGMELFALLQVLSHEEPDYTGRYQGQVGVTGPKAFAPTEDSNGPWSKFWDRHGT